MSQKQNFDLTFQQLRDILKPYSTSLKVVSDTANNYYLDTRHIMRNRKPLFFGSVRTGKSYVSFHLMPIYAYPELLDAVSPELKKRMQGKSCFNFSAPDARLFKELAKLTKAGFARYKAEKYV